MIHSGVTRIQGMSGCVTLADLRPLVKLAYVCMDVLHVFVNFRLVKWDWGGLGCSKSPH